MIETGDKRRGTSGAKPINSYKDLEIWQEGVRLVSNFYKLTSDFPKEENYGLTSQMRRAAISVPANIAEGYARNHRAELRQFLYIALGSLAELETLSLIARELGYTDHSPTAVQLEQSVVQLRHRTLAFLRSLR